MTSDLIRNFFLLEKALSFAGPWVNLSKLMVLFAVLSLVALPKSLGLSCIQLCLEFSS